MKLLQYILFPLFPLGVWLSFLPPVILFKSKGVGKKDIQSKRRKWLNFFTLLLTLAFSLFIISVTIPVEMLNDRFTILGLSLQFFGLISLIPSLTPLLQSISSDIIDWYIGEKSNTASPVIRRLRHLFNILFGSSMVGFNSRTLIWGLLAFGVGSLLQILGVIV